MMKLFKTLGILVGIGAIGGIGYYFYQGGTVADITDSLSSPTPNVDQAQADKTYRANRVALAKGYQKGPNTIARDYVDWQAASKFPADPGVHSGRYMMTYVNDIGHAEYTRYASTNVSMPVGSKVAKESFTIRGEGKFAPSPLFTMEKVGVDKAPDTNGWFYGRVNRNGRKMITSQKFCHSCHTAYALQDNMAYPVEEAWFVSEEQKNEKIKAPASFAPGNIAAGEKVFQACASCHQIGDGAKNAFGPVLTGVVGRPAGSYAGYSYSSSLKQAGAGGLVWNEELLFEWLAGPSKFLENHLNDPSAKSKMPINFKDATTRNDVIAYLESQ